jgi:hypothetical protein
MVNEITLLLADTDRYWAPRGLRRPRPGPTARRCRAPEPRLRLFLVDRVRQDPACLGPCGLRSHGADHADRDAGRSLRPSDDAGTHHEAGPWSASRSRPPEGARGQGRLREADTRQHRRAIPRNG